MQSFKNIYYQILPNLKYGLFSIYFIEYKDKKQFNSRDGLTDYDVVLKTNDASQYSQLNTFTRHLNIKSAAFAKSKNFKKYPKSSDFNTSINTMIPIIFYKKSATPGHKIVLYIII